MEHNVYVFIDASKGVAGRGFLFSPQKIMFQKNYGHQAMDILMS